MSLNRVDKNGNELVLIIQKLIDHTSEKASYTLLTNDQIVSNISKKELTGSLKNTTFSTNSGSLSDKMIVIRDELKNKASSRNEVIFISDFQYTDLEKNDWYTDATVPLSLVNLQREIRDNISIDSVFINRVSLDGHSASIVIKNQGKAKTDIPIALFNGSKLINKRTFSVGENQIKTIEFTIEDLDKFEGEIQLLYNEALLFDNTFYFAVGTREKIPILNIGEKSRSFSKIFDEEIFHYTSSSLNRLRYDLIPSQQLIILNQLQEISEALKERLLQFLKNKGHLLIIPDRNIKISSYNSFFNQITTGSIYKYKTDSLRITKINFQHPLFTDVFSDVIANFQYPSVTTSLIHNLQGDQILAFENKTPFLQEITNPLSKIFWFSSPLDKKSSNFENSPLIVPTLYNIGSQSLKFAKPYYILHQINTIEIKKKITKSEILTISNSDHSFLPMQRRYANKIIITTDENPIHAGFYKIFSEKELLETVAYNIDPKESLLSFYDLNTIERENKNVHVYHSVEEPLLEINEKNDVHPLWTLFLITAIVSLLLEISILKLT